jgi:predicted nucleic acid-binding protein
VTACVLDASVAAKWFLPPDGESLVPEARQVLQDYCSAKLGLLVPGLFWPEIGNVLWKSFRCRRISLRSAEDALQTMRNLKIATAPSEPLIEDALAIASAFDRTVYDAIYVALARERDIPLVTADERLVNALAPRFPVRWLGAL